MHYTRGERREIFQERLELEMNRVTKECLDGAERLTWTNLEVSPAAMDQWIGTLDAALIKLRMARTAKARMVRA